MNIVGRYGASLPLTMPTAIAQRAHRGRADAIWDVAFTTKFSKKPAEDAPLVTPHGALTVIDAFVSRAAELDYLINTQHRELATTQQTLRANGIDCVSLSQGPAGTDPIDVTDGDLSYADSVDPTFISTMKRRIDWERFIFACGPIHKARFEATPEGLLGIAYDGPKKFATPEVTLATRRALKERWLAIFGSLPTLDRVEEGRAFAAYYGNRPVLAHMSEDERNADTDSRRFGTDDPDPFRGAFDAPAPAPKRADYGESEEERDEYNEDYAAWRAAQDGVGYAGPIGFLGLDDEAPALDDEFEYPAG